MVDWGCRRLQRGQHTRPGLAERADGRAIHLADEWDERHELRSVAAGVDRLEHCGNRGLQRGRQARPGLAEYRHWREIDLAHERHYLGWCCFTAADGVHGLAHRRRYGF